MVPNVRWELKMLRFVSKISAAVLMAACVSAISFPAASIADIGSLTWTLTEEDPQYWSAIAASYDGRKLVAASVTGEPTPPEAYHGNIFTSDDSGVTWTKRAPSAALLDWQSVASSSDGQKLVICWTNFDGEGEIYTSVNSGITWNKTSAPAINWVAVTSSADGNILAAAARGADYSLDGDKIYTSDNGGATWVERPSAGSRQWSSISSDSSGNKLVAVDRGSDSRPFGGLIYTSSDAGLTWNSHAVPSVGGFAADGAQIWNTVTSSGDGTRLAAAGRFGKIYTSSDSGLTWIENSPLRDGLAFEDNWASVSMSHSGKTILASIISGNLYVSNDYGLTWTTQTSIASPLNFNWTTSVISRDGSLLIAGQNNDSEEPGGYLWTTSLPAEPTDDSDAVAEAARVAAAAEAARVAAAAEAARLIPPPVVYIPPPPQPYLSVGIAPAIRKVENLAVCSSGTYDYGVTYFDGTPNSLTKNVSPAVFLYKFFIDGAENKDLAVSSAAGTISIPMSKLPATGLLTCQVTVQSSGVSIIAASTLNAAGVGTADAQLKTEIEKANLVYQSTLKANADTKKSALIANRKLWRDSVQLAGTVFATSRTAAKSSKEVVAASKIQSLAVAKAAANYKQGIVLIDRDYLNMNTLAENARKDSHKNANSVFAGILETSGYGVTLE